MNRLVPVPPCLVNDCFSDSGGQDLPMWAGILFASILIVLLFFIAYLAISTFKE